MTLHSSAPVITETDAPAIVFELIHRLDAVYFILALSHNPPELQGKNKICLKFFSPTIDDLELTRPVGWGIIPHGRLL